MTHQCDRCEHNFCKLIEQIEYYESVIATEKDYIGWVIERLEKQNVKKVIFERIQKVAIHTDVMFILNVVLAAILLDLELW